ncbi:RagB/SusD family nutrient uptake outer membrane protein [Bacteroidales bacterium OttesenSCG-928-J19]|nr:RagB/SusD family nutrient uptake outer membrane protein [Bacteroidales bacterium OttesenSCG-928-J19]
MVQFYCDAWKDSSNGTTDGVVLRLTANMDDLPLSSLADCYTQIYIDLDNAIELFEESNLNREEVFDNSAACFPDINMAYAIYARAALNKDDYTNALKYAKLAQVNYPLMSVADYKSGFVAPTSEWIWGSYNDGVETLYYWSFQVMMAYNGYYGNAGEITTASRTLIESFPSSDIRKGLFVHEGTFLESGQTFLDVVLASNSEFNGATDAGKEARTKATAYAKAATANKSATIYYPYANLKFAATGLPGIGCVPFIRTSEMVLIEAEANYFLNNTEDAQKNMNALNADTGRDTAYNCTATGPNLLEEIILYRRLELWGEGHSWLDCKRWKRNVVRPGIDDGGNFHAAISGTWGTDASFWKWAVPDRERDYNSALD